MRAFISALFFATIATIFADGASEGLALREQLDVLGKQVTALLERRSEDLRSIEEHVRRRLFESGELGDVKDEIQNLRSDLEWMRGKVTHRLQHQPREKHAVHVPTLTTTEENNDRLTMKWLSNSMSEVRTELKDVLRTVNATEILANRGEFDTTVKLMRAEVASLNKQMEVQKRTNAEREAFVDEMREEVAALRGQAKSAAVECSKTKNQLKAAVQLEPMTRASRHQRVLKKHVLDLEKVTRELRTENLALQTQLANLERRLETQTGGMEDFDRINGNEVEGYLRDRKIKEVKGTESYVNLEEQQQVNALAIQNLTEQFGNFDKLHLSMLELLENVEGIEARVDKTLPEFRREISKLEGQTAEVSSKLAALKEDQENTRASMKAIGVSVSNLQDKSELVFGEFDAVKEDVEKLMKSSVVQNSKLHDHILKGESGTADLNATKSTIHLVQELKSFEKEYKSIVNKLPHDCNAVEGPDGVYLISPGDGEPILAYCSKGWTTVQKRYDGSVDFNRNWNDYSSGFGSATGEHWLGNRNLHHLTSSNCTTLEINMKDIYGKYWQASYDQFLVDDYANGFRLVVDKYRGNASDALDYQNRMEFSTVDNDRDISNTHCANNYEGGWWFSHCQHANLNGRYSLGLTWFDSSRNEWIAVATSEMRLKKRDHC